MLLTALGIGECAIIEHILEHSLLYTRLTDLGFSNGAEIECLFKSPLGDPTAYLIKGTVIALRSNDAKNIIIRRV